VSTDLTAVGANERRIVHLLLLSVGFGLVTSAIIALSATAFSLQYSVTSVPNFMHGEFLTGGAYGVLAVQSITHNLFIGVVVGLLVGGLLALLMDLVIVEPFLKRGSPAIRLLVVSVTVGTILQAAQAIIFSADPQNLQVPGGWYTARNVGPFIFNDVDFVIMAAAVLAMLAIHCLLQYTKFGKAQRAVADSRELAAASGISPEFVIRVTWVLVGVLAALAGILLAATQQTFDPFFGFNFLLVTLSAAVVGGIGRPYGAMIGALIIGLVTEVSAVYVNASYKQVAALLVLIIALMFRPSGLFTAVRERD
jgi:branched-subunit amino acid ABC-type transport system permease component